MASNRCVGLNSSNGAIMRGDVLVELAVVEKTPAVPVLPGWQFPLNWGFVDAINPRSALRQKQRHRADTGADVEDAPAGRQAFQPLCCPWVHDRIETIVVPITERLARDLHQALEHRLTLGPMSVEYWQRRVAAFGRLQRSDRCV